MVAYKGNYDIFRGLVGCFFGIHSSRWSVSQRRIVVDYRQEWFAGLAKAIDLWVENGRDGGRGTGLSDVLNELKGKLERGERDLAGMYLSWVWVEW